MNKFRLAAKSLPTCWLAVLTLGGAAALITGCGSSSSQSPSIGKATTRYSRVNLVADKAGLVDGSSPAGTIDAKLGNAWGIAFSPTGPFWIADNHTGFTTLYDGAGATQPLTVTIPSPAGGTPPAAPTGMVYNGATAYGSSTAFNVSSGSQSGSSSFLFATEDGTLSGWNATVNPTQAILAVDRSGTGAVYKGLAQGNSGGASFLYATNFNAGMVEMFDSNFQLVKSFTDPTVDAGFAPFGIQNIGGNLFVTFARQNAAKHDDVRGAGNGFVDVFDTSGKLLRRFAAHGTLNSPWGIAQAPAGFGGFSAMVLIGNFGDGRISAFKADTGAFMGQLNDTNGSPLVLPGLWALSFGNGGQAGSTTTLYFTSGPNGETDGIFGSLQATSP